MHLATGERLLTPAEVAGVFRVDPKTVTRWAAAGKLPGIRTPGGHYRFDAAQIAEVVAFDGGDTGPVKAEAL
jgi:excisionase family DNA binding protein